MKAGDLVTLSAYALQTEGLRRWSRRIWIDKRPLVGLIVEVRLTPKVYRWTSKNEKTRYHVKWMQSDGPNGRWGRSYGRNHEDAYFLRNDLKFVKKGEFE